MRKLLFTLCAGLLLTTGGYAQPTPRQLLPGLFEAVQLGRIFPDNKTFVDAVPLQSPATILAAWQQQKDTPGFRLEQFVRAHFRVPDGAAVAYQSNVAAGLRPHLDTLWTVLQRQPETQTTLYSSLLPLPRPYVVPGGRFREVYYWDSYFTMLGLQQAGRTALVRSMTDNFAYLINQYGFIPNGNRTYYLTRSQPPFFALMVQLLAEAQSDTVLRRYQAPLLREYAYWMAGADSLAPGTATRRVVRLRGGELLNRYWDDSTEPREESYVEDVEAARHSKQPAPQFYRNIRAAAASGWDFSTRWFGEEGTLASIRTTELVPVDLNCLLLTLEETIARTYAVQGQRATARQWEQKVRLRRQAIQLYCWNPAAGWFTDYDLTQRRPAAIRTLAGLFPLAFEVATPRQARQVVSGLQRDFLKEGGLLTTLTASGQQWDAPNAWAPLQYIAVQGLRRTRHPALADTVSNRWVRLNARVFQQTGKLLEKYNVIDTHLPAGGGEYPLQDGFGWTNGVLLKFLDSQKARR
ncbi:alpha,alpha-trehalase TreF [Hymenobacter psychrotolerans]|uniref:Alpha,alpha-trehalase n=1 Tax=Hymenobacter psychrotolerans DSM 18569 TaxID=1121959 RepID=A0A1M6PLC7_9BACT|nr:alpha,alpha-trehalase TreF [Hymenobacter psychrotolerans]SHK08738.1 alpha,alpha-trehalase [Hymenobacter psychrotolerans DSM 18569]